MKELFTGIKRKSKRELAKRNYEINSKCDRDPLTATENLIVNDQNGKRGESFVYGDYPASHNACEAIAVHNARVLLGQTSTLTDTIALFQDLGAMIFRGFFGSNVYRIGRVLKSLGMRYRKVKLKRMTLPGIYIISFWNKRPLKNGLHTVTVVYDGKKYVTYNLFGNGVAGREDPKNYAKKFIVGYYLEESGQMNS